MPETTNKRLPERMGVPMGARARLEPHQARAQRAGAGASMIGSCQTTPVKLSGGPRRDGTEPHI